MRVDDIMCTPVASVRPDAGLSKIAALMADTGVRRVLVMQDGKVFGTITAGSLLNSVSHFPDKSTREVLRSIAGMKGRNFMEEA